MGYDKWYISGDTHQNFQRFKDHAFQSKENVAVIILGDNAVNWTLNEADYNFKRYLTRSFPGVTWYLLRGNHDARPTALPNLLVDWDDNIQGYIQYEPDFLQIRYLLDGGEYVIDGHPTLTIGGAYSVDKWYRLQMGYRWFSDEQLTDKEMNFITNKVRSKQYDFVFTHTCPYSWRPIDLFMPGLDQSTVDNTMEHWFEGLKDAFIWDVWLFGHFHADRLERPHVEQLYKYIQEISEIWDRWHSDEPLPWWISKSPDYYMGA